MKIGNFDTSEKVLIIAEIGNNHEGDFELAKEMIRHAAEAGVDAVKFQTFKTEDYISKLDAKRFSRIKSFELSHNQFEELSNYSNELDLLFISTPFVLASADALSQFADALKVASGDNNFFPLLKKIAGFDLPIILSTGLLETKEIRKTVQVFEQAWPIPSLKNRLALLHCVCSYPVPQDQANLFAIKNLISEFEYTVGYSDHVMGNQAAVLAVALGSRIIEKHFTLNHHLSDFRDHQLSANPKEMKDLVLQIRSAETMLGDGFKKAENCETDLVNLVRRSAIVNKGMKKGSCISSHDISWVRPAGGIAPGDEHVMVGKRLNKDLQAGDHINKHDIGD